MSDEEELLSDEDALANAELARSELRTQIDQQLKTADSIDAKASTLLAAGAAVIALVAGRIEIDGDPLRIAAAILLQAVSLALLFSALRALASRDTFAYGADAQALVDNLEQVRPPELALALVEALRQARDRNNTAVNGKHNWYMWTVGLLFALAVSIAILFAVGASK